MISKRNRPRGGSTQVALSPELAIAAIGLFSTFADGEPSADTETAALGEMLSSIDLYEDYSEEEFEALGTEIAHLINDEGVEIVVAQAVTTANRRIPLIG